MISRIKKNSIIYITILFLSILPIVYGADTLSKYEQQLEDVKQEQLENSQKLTGVEKEICKRFGCKKVAITLRESINASHNGWSGVIYDATGAINYSIHYDIDIVDRVGGGDSFTGAMIYSLITGKDDRDAIEFAVAASCLKQSIEGDFNREVISDVEDLIKNGGNGRVQR